MHMCRTEEMEEAVGKLGRATQRFMWCPGISEYFQYVQGKCSVFDSCLYLKTLNTGEVK